MGPAPSTKPFGPWADKELGSPETVSRRRSAPVTRILVGGPVGQGSARSGSAMPVVYRQTGGRRRFQRSPALSGASCPTRLTFRRSRQPAFPRPAPPGLTDARSRSTLGTAVAPCAPTGAAISRRGGTASPWLWTSRAFRRRRDWAGGSSGCTASGCAVLGRAGVRGLRGSRRPFKSI